ncbi:ABC transporter ATP-binding protein [Aliiroseovarius sp. S1339]|uniref:ABC transporter ATP-binding protein n=1 Tax=Aliiroseovarius sp. S1339 TaxID=2936990 RepID=UPI0020BDBDEF|nr:ABC transporter ATP-binding protein [Aliiroseovarius sp. S1339]MCK8464334.1 ABC transporter ATP-binding protein [Aliiroseovarius sp. S1339]
MTTILNVSGVTKTYEGGFQALKGIDLEIEEGEILALLGPNGAGKTTLISIICGISTTSSGTITVGGFDHVKDYRAARDMIGLVPQEINLEPFETVMNTVRFSRGLFGRPRDDARIEEILKLLSLHDKKDSRIMTLSGGMKRRVLIAKALCHDPNILFLDEPTAGVDVELRKDMWDIVAKLKQTGVTVILTTHYIEEAEAMADRIGVISKGEILLIEDKDALIKRLGRKELIIECEPPVDAIPDGLAQYALTISDGGELVYSYDTHGDSTGITGLLADLRKAGLQMTDLSTRQSSLEDIFVDLVKEDAA